MLSTRMLTPLALIASSLLTAQAAPWPTDVKHSTHRKRQLPNGVEIESYNPESSFESFSGGLDLPLRKRDDAEATIEEAAADFVASRLRVDDVHVRSSTEGEAGRYIFFQQKLNDIPVINAVANIALTPSSEPAKILSLGANFVQPSKVGESTPVISEEDALVAAEKALEGTRVDFPVELRYFINDKDEALLAYVLQVDTAEKTEGDWHWYEAVVDATNGSILSVSDFVAHATYLALPAWKVDPREGFDTLVNPQDTLASPNGWHQVGTTVNANTQGNNVITYKGSTSSVTSESSSGVYNYAYASGSAPSVTGNVNNARTSIFVVGNQIHDVSYRYGFTEATYNFQQENFGKGGAANDRVLISVQDSSGTNNANFATPRDGQSGQMRMYIWTSTTPNRDGDLENDIPIHEYTHGITNRMTGGGTGSCLQTTEAGGMGEGWGDAYSLWFRSSSSATPNYVLGEWVTNKAAGIRAYPYSTSLTTNPYTYKSITSLSEVHAIGTVWATILYQVYAELVKTYGFAADARTNPASTAGNAIWLHLFHDALLIQPCNPTFLTGRSAWISAEQTRYGGLYKCAVWRGFAARGLGTNAVRGTDSSTLPSGC